MHNESSLQIASIDFIDTRFYRFSINLCTKYRENNFLHLNIFFFCFPTRIRMRRTRWWRPTCGSSRYGNRTWDTKGITGLGLLWSLIPLGLATRSGMTTSSSGNRRTTRTSRPSASHLRSSGGRTSCSTTSEDLDPMRLKHSEPVYWIVVPSGFLSFQQDRFAHFH